MRVVTLIASATEIVCALGQGHRLVGRSHECDHPPAVQDLPQVSEPRFEMDLPSAEIDRSVRDLVREALSIYRVDPEALRDLRPDLLITQTQCEVCAVTPEDVDDALADWTGARPRILSLHPDRLEDIWSDIRRVGQALDAQDEAQALVQELKARIERVSDAALARPERPRALFLEWTDPIMSAGNWTAELLDLAGAEAVAANPGGHAPQLTWDEVRDLDPEVLLIGACGYDLDRAEKEIAGLRERPGWGELTAVRHGNVFAVDGNAIFNRPGPRVTEALEVLAEVLHPEGPGYGHGGVAWRRIGPDAEP